MPSVDLNCDMGESYGVYRLGMDDRLLKVVSSANVACGFHAGDPSTIRRTVRACLENGTALGAHPGLPDLAGFGRRTMSITPEEAYDMVVYQVGAVKAFAEAEGGKLHHVKPHGALYNMAAADKELAAAIARAVCRVDASLILYGLSGSRLVTEGEKAGIRTASEVFADRTYQDDGSLTPRGEKGAVIDDLDAGVEQVLRIVREGWTRSVNGAKVAVRADTICVHGDSAHALELAEKLRAALEREEIDIKPL